MAEEPIPDEIRKLTFEQALEALQKIVNKMEQGESALDQAITDYERGALLKRHCENKLREAKQQVDKISLGPGGAVSSEPFED